MNTKVQYVCQGLIPTCPIFTASLLSTHHYSPSIWSQGRSLLFSKHTKIDITLCDTIVTKIKLIYFFDNSMT